jgi:hypothetical protein
VAELLIAAIGLGIAGLDPLGGLIAIGALSGGARERAVVAYGLAVILVTAVFGTVLSLTVGPRLADIDWSFLDSGYEFWAVGEAIVGVGLLVWAIRRILSPVDETDKPKKRGISTVALLGTGIVFGLSMITDPTYVAMVVLAGREGAVVDVSLAHTLWILVSQSPLVLITGAVLLGKHEVVTRRFQTWWEKVRPVVAKIGIGLAVIAGGGLVADAGWWFFTGEFLLDY